MTKLIEYGRSPSAFRQDLAVDVDGTVRRFGDVQDPWQRADFTALDPALLRVAGTSRKSAPMRAWWERGRGHDKTSGIAKVAAWLLAFARRPIRGYCYAADRDQAGLLRDAMATLVRLNAGTLGSILEVREHRVVNVAQGHPAQGATLEIAASDVASSYGILPDFVVADELTHWSDAARALWDSLISSVAKRRNCLLLIIANAGFAESWQWAVREQVRTDPAWIFSRLDGPVATWITADRLAEQRRLLPEIAYRRLWLNQWSAAGGDALTPEDIARAFDGAHSKMLGTESGYAFCAGVDLGLVRDNSAVVVLAVDRLTGSLRLANAKVWRPIANQKIRIEDIENEILLLDKQYHLKAVGIDPWQAEHLGQRLEALTAHHRRNQRHLMFGKPWIKMLPPTAANLREQATLTIEAFQDHRISCYDYAPLRHDLLKLRAVEKSYGIRLESPRDDQGHGDVFSAFALALMVAHEESTRKTVTAGAVGPSTPAQAVRAMYGHHDQPDPRFGWGADAGSGDGLLSALNTMHKTDPFFRQFRR